MKLNSLVILFVIAAAPNFYACKKIKGCTDPAAINYDANANKDDGSCMQPPSSIGQSYGGGIVFYIDGTGKHGMIAASTDQSAVAKWINGTAYSITNANDSALGKGQSNTNLIISKQGAGAYAAKLCDDYSAGGFSDWFLPSRDELDLVYKNLHKQGIGGFTTNEYYWSSTEFDSDNAWTVRFSTSPFYNPYDKTSVYRVRAVRAF